jgi:hypothetical protein
MANLTQELGLLAADRAAETSVEPARVHESDHRSRDGGGGLVCAGDRKAFSNKTIGYAAFVSMWRVKKVHFCTISVPEVE